MVVLIQDSSNTRYVSNSGSDSQAGTFNRPMATIPAAIASMPAGGRILLERGSSWDGFDIRINNLTFEAYNDGPEPLIDCNTFHGINVVGYRQDITVRNLRFEGTNSMFTMRNGKAILIEDCTTVGAEVNIGIGGSGDPNLPLEDVTIRNCIVRDCLESGIFASECQRLTIDQCTLYNNGLSSLLLRHNIYLSSAGSAEGGGNDLGMRDALVQDCMFGHAGGNYAIKFRTQTNGTIQRCTFTDNYNGIMLGTHWEEDVAVGNTIRDNTFITSGHPDHYALTRGIDVSGQQSCLIENNRFIETPFGDLVANPCINFQEPREFQVDDNDYCSTHTAPPLREIQVINNKIWAWPGICLEFGVSTCPPDVIEYESVHVAGNTFQQRTHNSGNPSPVVLYREGANPNITYVDNQIWGADADPGNWISYL